MNGFMECCALLIIRLLRRDISVWDANETILEIKRGRKDVWHKKSKRRKCLISLVRGDDARYRMPRTAKRIEPNIEIESKGSSSRKYVVRPVNKGARSLYKPHFPARRVVHSQRGSGSGRRWSWSCADRDLSPGNLLFCEKADRNDKRDDMVYWTTCAGERGIEEKAMEK